jgi:transcriptional regulator with XRE-family HTH domain
VATWRTDPEAWERLGRYLRAERKGRSRADVERLSSVSATMIQRYEDGKVHTRPPDKLWALIAFYRWTPDSLESVLNGGLPEYMPAPPPIPPGDPIRRGKLAEAIREHAGFTPEERRDLMRWLALDSADTTV